MTCRLMLDGLEKIYSSYMWIMAVLFLPFPSLSFSFSCIIALHKYWIEMVLGILFSFLIAGEDLNISALTMILAAVLWIFYNSKWLISYVIFCICYNNHTALFLCFIEMIWFKSVNPTKIYPWIKPSLFMVYQSWCNFEFSLLNILFFFFFAFGHERYNPLIFLFMW